MNVKVDNKDGLITDKLHSWHPFTVMSEYFSIPRISIERGKGCWIWDTEGNRYLDGNASVWTNVHGHSHPALVGAIEKQLSKIAHSTWLGLSHPIASKLTDKLISVCQNWYQRIFFSDNGSNAVEIAIKQSFLYWQNQGKSQKQKVICLEDAYHGDTFGTMSVGGADRFHGRFSHWYFESIKLSHPEEGLKSSLNKLEKILSDQSETIACFIVEPFVQGAAGMRLVSDSFLKASIKLCKKYQVQVIFDEIFIGFGRLGRIIPSISSGLEADFICLGKGLSGGYLPLAATLTTEEVYQTFLGDFSEGKTFFHGHTFTANPLASAVALENIYLLEPMIESGDLQRRISYFNKKIDQHFLNHPLISSINHSGFCACLKLNDKDHSPELPRIALHFVLEARKKGLILRPLGDAILLVPPICISYSEIDFLCENLFKALQY